MIWLTSLPAAVLVAGGVALALLVAAGARLALRALIPTAERDSAYTIAAPLMPALGATFAILMALTLASEAGVPGVGTRDRQQRGRRRIPPGLGGDQPRRQPGTHPVSPARLSARDESL